MKKTVVILVDNRKRDLPGCVLIAHHLEERFQIKAELQPLESWRSCLPAFRPDYILFNHLTASHLAHFSQILKDMGILVGVLPNEGINYDLEDLDFNAGRYHSYAQIDQFFCWNEFHKQALMKNMGLPADAIHVVGVPRFDYYFEPWKKLFERVPAEQFRQNRPHLLFCTNFVYAKFKDLPRFFADRHFRAWKDRIPSLKDYWEIIEVNARSRAGVFAHLRTILEGTDYFLHLKPHPGEDHVPYKRWFKGLSPEVKKKVQLHLTETIFEVLPLCDLEISCERCTTALEAWILGKPTIELVFEKHPAFFDGETAKSNRLCDSPDKLPGLIDYTLQHPDQDDLKELRRQHLVKWCASPSGTSSYNVAQIIAKALESQEKPKWDFQFQDWRRAVKMKTKNFLGLAYGSNPWKLLWSLIPTNEKNYRESKFIRPADVRIWKEKLLRVESRKH